RSRPGSGTRASRGSGLRRATRDGRAGRSACRRRAPVRSDSPSASAGSVCHVSALEASMKITVIGRGNVGGGLAKLWRAAGPEVQELGRDGGDASGADVVLVAVPGGSVDEALAKVQGLQG